MSNYERPISDFKPGEDIELHPCTDQWIMGDMYGTVVKIGRKYVHVKMRRSGRTLKVAGGFLRKVAD